VFWQTVDARANGQTVRAPRQTRLPAQNHLIDILAREDRRRLLAICEPVTLVLGQVVCDADTPTRYLYFPIDSFISMVATVAGSPGVEVGMVGREGLLGSHLVLGLSKTTLRGVVQGPGSALRLAKMPFRRELQASAGLRRVLNRYVAVLMVQLATSAVCLRYHQIGPRMARWLLMSHDRAGTDTFRVTHEFLSYMLGVRRVGITSAASELQRLGVIEYRRGLLTVLNRIELESASCACYEADRRAYSDALN
jgi:CRP-like cAMP-binding protein